MLCVVRVELSVTAGPSPEETYRVWCVSVSCDQM